MTDAERYALAAKRLKQALLKTGMKQQELANSTGITKASISQYVNGVVAPKVDHAQKMSKVLRVPPEWLMGLGDDVPVVFFGLEKDPHIMDFITGYSELSDVEKLGFWHTLQKLTPKSDY